MEVFSEPLQFAIDAKDDVLALQLSHSPTILERLYVSKQNSDVNFRVKDGNCAAHKNIMAACSPVLNALFSNEMKEKETNEVKIDDVEGSVFAEMLCFIYTRKVKTAMASAEDLLSVADKYDLIDLKLISQHRMITNLSIETAAKYLVLADLYSAHCLKRWAMEYIGRYSAAIITTEGWKQMAKSYPILVVELYEHQDKNAVPVHTENTGEDLNSPDYDSDYEFTYLINCSNFHQLPFL